jgi:oxygen-independent coproporphyrinogen-3 oxidase
MRAARFGLYIHFPYCIAKCPYCDFASAVARVIPDEAYTKAVCVELEARAVRGGLVGRTLDSVYFGGGTPSLWQPRSVEKVLDLVRRLFVIPPHAELTLEANPGAVDAARFRDFRSLGLNRLSLGVQSFDPLVLARLGRAHDAETARQAVAHARGAGFDNLSLDFIYGVQGQSLSEVRSDVTEALAFAPEHLSLYALTLDRASLAEEVPLGKQLARGAFELPTDEAVVEMQHAIGELCTSANLSRYEISNYSKPDKHSVHNCLYWTAGEYLAVGSGATGCLRTPTGAERYSNPRSAERYLEELHRDELPSASVEVLSREELFRERLAMGLRLTSGVDVAAVCAELGQSFSARQVVIRQLVDGGLATEEAGRVALTEAGLNLHSAVCARLM